MKLVSKYIVILTRVVIVVTIAASSGLATVIHRCTMTDMDCCSGSSCEDNDTCSLPGVPLSGPAISSDFACQVVSFVGGATIKSGESVQDKNSRLTRIMMGTVTLLPNLWYGETTGSSQTLFSLAALPLPPSVEKCVLYASLLI